MSKNWQEAGDAYVKAAEIYEKNLKEPHDACTRYIEAARAYRNVDTKAAIKYFGIAVDMHMEGNRFSVAAKLYKDIAELYEKEMDHEGAKQAFTKAADVHHHHAHTHTTAHTTRSPTRLSAHPPLWPPAPLSAGVCVVLRRGGQHGQLDGLLGEGGRAVG